MPSPPSDFDPAISSPSASRAPVAGDGGTGLTSVGSPVNLVLIGASIFVTLYTSWGQNIERMIPLLISLSPMASPGRFSEVLHGEVWRLFTPMFLHYNLQHLGFNMLGMVNLGAPLEKIGGSRRYAVLCLVLALCSNLGEYLIGGQPSFGGMSGVLYGLFGYIWLRGRSQPGYPLRMPTETIVIALGWFVLCFTHLLGPIANSAHAVGMVVGALWGAYDGRSAIRREVGRATLAPGGFDPGER